jgi:hypothetical protein
MGSLAGRCLLLRTREKSFFMLLLLNTEEACCVLNGALSLCRINRGELELEAGDANLEQED